MYEVRFEISIQGFYTAYVHADTEHSAVTLATLKMVRDLGEGVAKVGTFDRIEKVS